MRLGTLIYKCWTCSQIYKAYLGTCVCMSASSMGKLSKVTTISLLPFFFLCAFELYNLWNCHSTVQLIQGGHTIHNILHIFESLNCPSCHVPHSSGQLFCKYPLDRKLWQKVAWSWVVKETATPTFANRETIFTFLVLCSFSFLLLSSLHSNNSFRRETLWR